MSEENFYAWIEFTNPEQKVTVIKYLKKRTSRKCPQNDLGLSMLEQIALNKNKYTQFNIYDLKMEEEFLTKDGIEFKTHLSDRAAKEIAYEEAQKAAQVLREAKMKEALLWKKSLLPKEREYIDTLLRASTPRA